MRVCEPPRLVALESEFPLPDTPSTGPDLRAVDGNVSRSQGHDMDLAVKVELPVGWRPPTETARLLLALVLAKSQSTFSEELAA